MPPVKGDLRAVLVAAALVAVPLMLVATPTPAVAGNAWLTVSPKVYVGGQAVTFKGDLGTRGRDQIWLQLNFNRPGDEWTDIPDFHRRTHRDGSFRFKYVAPSMFNTSYRVVSRSAVTPGFLFNARSQEVLLHVPANAPNLKPRQELAGTPYSINVETAPSLRHRADLPPPVIPDRTLTLQQQNPDGSWQTLAQSATDAQGLGTFTVAGSDVAGCYVYRVREEDYTKGANEIGWFPSFPYAVAVVTPGVASASCPHPVRAGATSAPPTWAPSGRRPVPTAGETYHWPRLWDFTWEEGQSLTSPPWRGSVLKGWWLDRTTGYGRVAHRNGGVMLDSQRDRSGRGDFGTTSLTLHGNAMAYGRWEAKMRFKRGETGARDYHARIELIPNSPKDYACGAHNITVADVLVGGSSIHIGATNGTKQWRATRQMTVPEDRAVTFAVEVTPRHVTWFYKGSPIGTVKSRAASSDIPMTMRLSLVGDQNYEMNKTTFMSDWQRGFDLSSGTQVTRGGSLNEGTFSGGC